MDDLILASTPWLLGLMLFSAFWAVERLSHRRHRRRLERRLMLMQKEWMIPAGTPFPYSRMYPNIPKPYQKRVR